MPWVMTLAFINEAIGHENHVTKNLSKEKNSVMLGLGNAGRQHGMQARKWRRGSGHQEDHINSKPLTLQRRGFATTLAHLPHRCSMSPAKQHRADADLAQPQLWLILHPTRGCVKPINMQPLCCLVCSSCILNIVPVDPTNETTICRPGRPCFV
jgi:hypothetical protein